MPLSSMLSIIVSVYNEAENISIFCEELHASLEKIGKKYEIIFINDGSSDNSLEILKSIARDAPAIKIISFSRNFGQTAALSAGIAHAAGDIIVMLDADLQNDPQDIPVLIHTIEQGYDLVSGWRQNRQDNFLTRRLPSSAANHLISFLTNVHLHDYGCTLKAYKKDIIKGINLYGEMHRFIPVYASWIGARIIEVPVNHRRRLHGKSKYNLWRIMKVILDLITIKFLSDYETKPIYVFGGSGLAFLGLSFFCIITLLYNKFFLGISMIQSPILLLSALFVMVGVQLVLIGLLAEILIRTYFESAGKPTYYIKERINL